MKYKAEVKPKIFLDILFFFMTVYSHHITITEVKRNEREWPVHWSSKVPKRYKRNAVISELNRATRIVSFLADEISKIQQNFLNADYPHRFINSVINNLQEKIRGNWRLHHSAWFLWCSKEGCIMDIPYCPKNEKISKCFMKKFNVFTDNEYNIRVKWITKKVKQSFKLKCRNFHPSCVIYECACSCQESYIGETVRNVEIRWQEHEDTQKDSEPVKHLKNNPTYSFTWKVLLWPSSIRRIRQNKEALVIPLKRPSLKCTLMQIWKSSNIFIFTWK